MLRVLLLKLWPVFIPLGFYLLWRFILSRRTTTQRRIAEHIEESLLFWAVLTSLALLIGSLIWWGMNQETDQRSGQYMPPKVVDGELVPGHVVPSDRNNSQSDQTGDRAHER